MLLTVKLNPTHKKDRFTCEEQSLENYLRKQAGQDVRRQVAACFILEGEGATVRGYYTLSADCVDRDLIPENLQKKFPYRNLPVTFLGRLARDSKLKGNGIGEILLADALTRAWMASSAIGSCAVVTDSINEKARNFYASFGFISLQNGRMFIPMETISASLG